MDRWTPSSTYKNNTKYLLTSSGKTDIISNGFADMAQEVERILGKDEVTGSTPVISSKKSRSSERDFFIQADRLGISSR